MGPPMGSLQCPAVEAGADEGEAHPMVMARRQEPERTAGQPGRKRNAAPISPRQTHPMPIMQAPVYR